MCFTCNEITFSMYSIEHPNQKSLLFQFGESMPALVFSLHFLRASSIFIYYMRVYFDELCLKHFLRVFFVVVGM